MSDLAKELMKAFSDAAKTKNQKTVYFDTGYAPLNKIVSGSYDRGLPSGRITEISGASQSGKTLIAVEIAIQGQKMGGAVLYIDYERRFNIEFAEARGLNPNPPHFFWVKGTTWEQGVSYTRKWSQIMRKSADFPMDVPLLVVIDSVAAAIAESRMDDQKLENTSHSMKDHLALPSAISQTISQFNQNGDDYAVTTLMLNQIRENPGAYGSPNVIPGGRSIGFYADVRIELTKAQDKEGADIVGQIVSAKATKCPTTPNGKTRWVLKFLPNGMTVLDHEVSLVEYAIEMGVITSPSKGYYNWDNLKLRKKEIIARVKDENKTDFLVEHIRNGEVIQ